MTLETLSTKHQAFVAAYLVGETMGNSAASAVKAGYSAETAPDLMARPAIRKAIADGQAAAAAETRITKNRVMAELGRIAFSRITDVVSWRGVVVQTGEMEGGEPVTRETSKIVLTDSDDISPDVTAAIAEVSESQHGTKVKMYDKVAALIELGRHLGVAQRVALTGPDGKGPVETIIREMTPDEAVEAYRRTLEEGKMPT